MELQNTAGVAHFYYASQVPERAVAIARIQAEEVRPAELTNLNNTPLTTERGPAPLTVSVYPAGTLVTTATLLGQTISFTGHTAYLLENLFFDFTNVADGSGNPLYYQHVFPVGGINNVTVLDLTGNTVHAPQLLVGNTFRHSYDLQPYWVEYYADGLLRKELLQHAPALSKISGAVPDDQHYSFTFGGVLTVFSSATTYYLRFTAQNSYSLLPIYNVPLNDPWYPRIRFTLRPVAREWGLQQFSPVQPYLQSTWVPGTVLSSNLIEFERPNIYWDGQTYPDVLVYDANNQLKYALDGTPPNTRVDKGYLYPWMRSQFLGMDPATGRVQVNVPLESTDICFGFYNYAENDVVFNALDVNPFTNTAVKNKVVQFYYADRANDVPANAPLNEGFETGDLSGWTFLGNQSYWQSTITTNPVKTGQYALSLATTPTTTLLAGETLTGQVQNQALFSAQPGDTFQLSFPARQLNGSLPGAITAAAGVAISMLLRDGTSSTSWYPVSSFPSGAWAAVGPITVTAPANILCFTAAFQIRLTNTSLVNITLSQQASYAVAFDDLSIVKQLPTATTTTSGITISTSTLPQGRAAVAYSTTLVAEGGTGYQWSVVAGNLPEGVTLATNGILSGTPVNSGLYDFVVQVTANGKNQQALLHLVILQPYGLLDPFNNIFYQVFNEDGSLFLNGDGTPYTNDPFPLQAGKEYFGSLTVGYSVGPDDFTVTDARVRGGGLIPQFQNLPVADHFWDLGYWDGKPYPLGGACAVYLPQSLLTRMTREEVLGLLQARLPVGVLPLVRYYDATGQETR